jgi:Escherichia/Staphylococcus phage prohead protease
MVVVKNKQTVGNKPIHYKSAPVVDVVIDESSRVIKFYAAVWGNIDDAQDILVKGCCSRSLQARGPASTTNRKIKFLYQHDTKMPLGLPSELKEDDHGLYCECPVDEIPKGDDVLVQLKSGTLNQFSIGYNYVWDKCEWTEVTDPENGQKVYALVCKEIELFEVSVVTFGCNEETEFIGMKDSQVKSHRNQLQRDTEALLKLLPVDQELQFRQLISKHIALAQLDPAQKPLEQTDPPNKSVNFKSLSNAFNN